MKLQKIGLDGIANLEIHNAAFEKNNVYSDLFKNFKEKDIYIETARDG